MSIGAKITLLFLFSLAIMASIGLWSDNSVEKRGESIQIEKYLQNTKEIFYLLSKGKKSKVDRYLEEQNLKSLNVDKIKDAQKIVSKPLSFGSFEILKKDGRLYLLLNYLDESILLYDKNQDELKKERAITSLLVFLDIALLLFMYLIILKMVSPLKEISSKMREISKGRLNARVEIDRRDEIGEMAKSFNEMAAKLQSAIKSKEELLRDVGHELRTPIAKGKFAVEMLPDSKGKAIIKHAFDDLDTLTNEILNIQIMDNEKEMQKNSFRVSTLIVEAISKSNLEKDENVKIDIGEDITIEGDLYYLSIALKNLIENALKYTTSLPIAITASSDRVCVASHGEKLTKGLEYYTRPFIRGTREKEGFGLGLNIAMRIVKRHGFKLTYHYEDGKNIFCIKFSRSALIA